MIFEFNNGRGLNQNPVVIRQGMDWGTDPENFQITTGYKRIRRINRALMETWFREISLVDIDTLPSEGGILFTTWHPGGMIDPMLMMASLPGSLTFAAKHTMFKIPIFSC